MPIRIGINAEARKRRIDDAVNAERDRRIRGNFVFLAHPFDFDERSKANIAGAATLAGFSRGEAGNLFWHGGAEAFSWVAADNTRVPMDAPTVFAFGQAAAEHERAHIYAARAIKDAATLPEDWTGDAWWP